MGDETHDFALAGEQDEVAARVSIGCVWQRITYLIGMVVRNGWRGKKESRGVKKSKVAAALEKFRVAVGRPS